MEENKKDQACNDAEEIKEETVDTDDTVKDAEPKEEPVPAEEVPVQEVIAEETAPVDDYPAGNPFEDSLESTRVINLSELKFGRNYTGE